jgi:hypothetical protein
MNAKASMSEPPSNDPKRERPGTTTLDYIALGLLLAPPAVLFEIYIKGEPIDWSRTAVATLICWVAGGLVVWASKVWPSWPPLTSWRILPSLVAAENKWWGKAVVIAVCMVGVLLLSSFLSNKNPSSLPPAAEFTQQQVDAKIAAATRTLHDQLSTANNTIAGLQAKAVALPPQPQQTAALSNQGPITWAVDSQFLVITGGGPDATINSVLLQGTSTASVTMKDAYAISGLTGHKQELMANVQYRGYYPVDKVDIPPEAPVWLELIWKPPLSIKEFLDQWGRFHVTVVYDDGTTYDREFDENYIRRKLQQQIPGAFGPRVTPRDDK